MSHDKSFSPNTKASHNSVMLPHSTTSLAEGGRATGRTMKKGSSSFSTHTFFGLLTKIKCNICSYHFNIWYVYRMFTLILNLFFMGIKYYYAIVANEHCTSTFKKMSNIWCRVLGNRVPEIGPSKTAHLSTKSLSSNSARQTGWPTLPTNSARQTD
jgi:hypothetical protein